jgi:hypothetical protein
VGQQVALDALFVLGGYLVECLSEIGPDGRADLLALAQRWDDPDEDLDDPSTVELEAWASERRSAS